MMQEEAHRSVPERATLVSNAPKRRQQPTAAAATTSTHRQTKN